MDFILNEKSYAEVFDRKDFQDYDEYIGYLPLLEIEQVQFSRKLFVRSR